MRAATLFARVLSAQARACPRSHAARAAFESCAARIAADMHAGGDRYAGRSRRTERSLWRCSGRGGGLTTQTGSRSVRRHRSRRVMWHRPRSGVTAVAFVTYGARPALAPLPGASASRSRCQREPRACRRRGGVRCRSSWPRQCRLAGTSWVAGRIGADVHVQELGEEVLELTALDDPQPVPATLDTGPLLQG
jgi:hypothetical protein